MDQETAKFEGWALVELYGHAKEAGYVSTVYFGPAAMFRVDVPEIPSRQETADRPRWLDGKLCPVGTIVEAAPIPGRTRYIGPGAIYSMNPASEEVVRIAVARMVERDVKIISMPEHPDRMLPGELQAKYPDSDEDGSYEEDEDEEVAY